MGRKLRIVVAISVLVSGAECYGQTAVPFLLIPNSVEGNGMGGIAASLVTNDAISNLSNPAQAGIFSLDNTLSISTYSPKTPWLPSFGSDLSLDATALSAGLRLDRYVKLPAPVSVGVGYSRIYFDLGTFRRTLPTSPTVTSSWHAFEKADMLTLGIGFNYVVRLGLGYSYKWIDSQLGPLGTAQPVGSGAAKSPAHDFGALLQVPVVDIVSRLTHEPIEFNNNISPLFNLTFGWAETNIGGNFYYPSIQQSDPLPREGSLGWNFEIGLKSRVNDQPWKFLSFTWAREANDVLVSAQTVATPGPSGDTLYTNNFSYVGGLGGIRPITNLLYGQVTGNITLERGWQIQIAQCLYLREGSYNPFGGFGYKTTGESFHLNGLVKLLAWLHVWNPQHTWIAYLVDHVDVQYNTSIYSGASIVDNTRFSSINIVFR